MYGWIITVDHISDPEDTEVGTIGPWDISPETEALLKSGNGHTFHMHDDDGILYYTGKIIADDMSEYCEMPLVDFGMPNAGAVSITYPRHSEWNCG